MAWRLAAVFIGLLLAAGLAITAPGDVRLAPRDAGSRRVCAAHPPRPDRELLTRCAFARGRVVWVRRSPGETHLALAAGFHLLVVKLPPGATTPRLGHMAAFTGALVRSRVGLRELEAS